MADSNLAKHQSQNLTSVVLTCEVNHAVFIVGLTEASRERAATALRSRRRGYVEQGKLEHGRDVAPYCAML